MPGSRDACPLVLGEIRTGLLRNSDAASPATAAAVLQLAPGERVRLSERPVARAVSPDSIWGVDCGLPTASGAQVRGVGTVTGRAVLTGGRVLQGSVHTRLERGRLGRRSQWSHYLALPGRFETIGRYDGRDVVEGFLSESAPGPTLDLGALSERLITAVQLNPTLDHVIPFRSRRTRLRWAAVVSDETGAQFTIANEDLRTFSLAIDDCAVGAVVEFCEDLALHDWVLTTLLHIVDRSNLGTAHGPEALARLRPVIDHLLHLWMPGARTARALLPLWEGLERRPGFTRQWQTTVTRIRDWLAVHTLEMLGRPERPVPGELANRGDARGRPL